MRTLALIISLALITPALAEPYTGVWASSAKACKADPHQTEDAAIRITKSEVRGGEWRCKITDRRITGNSWTVKAACAGEGETSMETFSSSKFTRCAEADFHPIAGD
uniref:hypothetical protein n=1 Tax=Methylobacterium sp. B34 TaxID=95563 RepID=UPI000346C9DB|nr:hypothetical protein [Methylobacterium sp. B34]